MYATHITGCAPKEPQRIRTSSLWSILRSDGSLLDAHQRVYYALAQLYNFIHMYLYLYIMYGSDSIVTYHIYTPYAPSCWHIYLHLGHLYGIVLREYAIHGAYRSVASKSLPNNRVDSYSILNKFLNINRETYRLVNKHNY